MTEASVRTGKGGSDLSKRPSARHRHSASGSLHDKARWLEYLKIYRAAPLERINRIKAGISAIEAKEILGDLYIAPGRVSKVLGIPISTLNRKAKTAKTLSTDESERILGLARLVGQVQAMVEDSGEPRDFDARAWTAQWLNAPLPAFGGARPVDLMDTMEGQTLVSDTLARIQSGAYA